MGVTQHNNPWGKLLVFVFAVLLSAIIIAASTYHALPESFWIVLGLLIISVGVAAILNYYSGDATPKIGRYCIISHIALATVMSFGLVIHVLLSREISIAKQNVAEGERREDRIAARRKQEMAQEAELLKSQAEYEKARAQSLRNEAIRNDSARRLGITPRQSQASRDVAPPSIALVPAQPADAAIPFPEASAPVVAETPQTIRQKYSGWLLASAILDVIFSILAAVVLVARWEWDRDKDGIADNLQGNTSPK